jgi:hypothetical protein
MPHRAAPPPPAPGPDATVYLVLDDFGELGSAYRETDPAEADLQTVVAGLLSGQYQHPLRVVAFNTAQGWARDVTGEVAREVLACAVALHHEPPPHVHDFVERASPRNPQASMPLMSEPVRPDLNAGDDPVCAGP